MQIIGRHATFCLDSYSRSWHRPRCEKPEKMVGPEGLEPPTKRL